MPLKVCIVDAHGTSDGLHIDREGVMPVIIHDHPVGGDDWQGDTYAAEFENDAGSIDMNVDGSTTPVEFFVKAQNDADIWVKTIKILISDPGAALNEFGALPALTNGVDFRRFSRASGDRAIKAGIKTNLDLVRIGNGPAFGDGTGAFKADISGSGADSYIIDIFLDQLFGFKDGVRLSKGTTESLSFRINDNLTGLTTFVADAYGRQI